jgi:hypothetical protein
VQLQWLLLENVPGMLTRPRTERGQPKAEAPIYQIVELLNAAGFRWCGSLTRSMGWARGGLRIRVWTKASACPSQGVRWGFDELTNGLCSTGRGENTHWLISASPRRGFAFCCWPARRTIHVRFYSATKVQDCATAALPRRQTSPGQCLSLRRCTCSTYPPADPQRASGTRSRTPSLDRCCSSSS